MVHIVWFRQDLRVADNPALTHAAKQGKVIAVYILEEALDAASARLAGRASRWWLHHSLAALAQDLGPLLLLRGDPIAILARLAKDTDARGIYWNRCYEPHTVQRDKAVKAKFAADGLDVCSFNASLLAEPWEIETQSGGPYKVYSPFWRALKSRAHPAPLPRPNVQLLDTSLTGDALEDWGLQPTKPNWAKGWNSIWTPGERGAAHQFLQFMETGLEDYGNLRDRPDLAKVSRLSPHLHFGEISSRQIWAQVIALLDRDPRLASDGHKFLSEVGWREFSAHLLYHFPSLPKNNWRRAFDVYPWNDDVGAIDALHAWQRGETGYPLIDAGMRELWQSGYMHNRVRMVAASFLVKHLRLHWSHGEAWFWDTLVDADLANNAASWQWVAGSGADAAPYFRIFNPMTQGRKFDPHGDYVRRWCPELSGLDNKYIHAPFEAPADLREQAGVILGKTYPAPIVDHAEARALALKGYEAVKAAG